MLPCCVDVYDLQAAARNAPQLTRQQIREMRRAHDPNFKERECLPAGLKAADSCTAVLPVFFAVAVPN